MNTSTCFKIAVVSPDELLCLTGVATSPTTDHIELHRIDLQKGSVSKVGTFPEACDGTYNTASLNGGGYLLKGTIPSQIGRLTALATEASALASCMK